MHRVIKLYNVQKNQNSWYNVYSKFLLPSYATQKHTRPKNKAYPTIPKLFYRLPLHRLSAPLGSNIFNMRQTRHTHPTRFPYGQRSHVVHRARLIKFGLNFIVPKLRVKQTAKDRAVSAICQDTTPCIARRHAILPHHHMNLRRCDFGATHKRCFGKCWPLSEHPYRGESPFTI